MLRVVIASPNRRGLSGYPSVTTELRKDRMAGREVVVQWQGRPVRAWVPDMLTERDLSVSEATARRTEQALAAVRRGSDAMPERWEALARLLLRAEGIASSFIEGVRAPLADVAMAEIDPTIGETASWIADNLAAVRAAIAEAHDGPLSTESLDRWHRTLMAGGRHLPDHLIGAPRDSQGWIGGTSPLDAALVTPPPELVGDLLADLVAFANRDDLDPITQAAVAHAQFEIVHPYADGNGRVGRVLLSWILTRRLGLTTPPPMSVRIAVDRGGYLSQMTVFRLGQVDPWVRWMADVVAGAGDATVNLVQGIAELETRWEDRLAGVRADATARRVLPLLAQHPVLASWVVVQELGVSARTATDALGVLGAAGVLDAFEPGSRPPGRPHRWWVATELVDLVAAWSR